MKAEKTISIPDAGITVLPPWGAYIVLGNKRHENRVRSVASFARSWIGKNIAITSSKNWDRNSESQAITKLFMDGLVDDTAAKNNALVITALAKSFEKAIDGWNAHRAGKIIAVAELVGVIKNSEGPRNYWQVSDQWSLVLGRVWEVEPVPCTGGPGLFRFGKCKKCGRLIALSYGAECAKCPPAHAYPEGTLSVIAERGPDGQEVRDGQ